jgi:hypothetical protein
LVYLGEQEDEEGKVEGKGLNRPARRKKLLQPGEMKGFKSVHSTKQLNPEEKRRRSSIYRVEAFLL